MAGSREREGRGSPRSEDRGAHRRDHPRHLHGPLRIGPAPLQGARARTSTPATSSGTSRWGSSRRSDAEVDQHRAGRPGRDPVQHLLRSLLDVRSDTCSRNARRPRTATPARAPPCSATPSSTGRYPAVRRSILRVPQAQFGPIKVPEGPPDDRFLFLSDVLPTAWQAVEYADVPDGGSVAVFGLGPIGQMSARIAAHRGLRVIGLDLDAGSHLRWRASSASR